VARKPPKPWVITFPAQKVRCPKCGASFWTRFKFYGRAVVYALKGGRGVGHQGVPELPTAAPPDL